MQNKKAQTNLAMVSSVVGVVVLLVAIGIIFSSSFKANTTLTNLAEDNVAAHVNESLVWGGNNTQFSLKETRIITSSVQLYNNGSKINQGAGANPNYTVSVASVTIINSTPGAGDAKGLGTGTWLVNGTPSLVNISYSYNYGSQERNITLLSGEGIKSVSDFQPTWALIVGIGILISAILLPLVIWIMSKI